MSDIWDEEGGRDISDVAFTVRFVMIKMLFKGAKGNLHETS